METKKMSLATIHSKLSRAEMKKIMAGSGGGGWCAPEGTPCGTGVCMAGHYAGVGGTSHGCCCTVDTYAFWCFVPY